MSRYKTARALEMAVKSAAKKSPMDTGAAIEGFYFHRLLVRIFAGGVSPFVLKGGHGMLARTTDARRTRDIDIVADGLDIDAALQELRALVSRDMDDFLSYEVTGYGPIKTGDRYRDGYSVSVSVMLGGRSMRPVSIDLVADEAECGRPEYLTPADRLEIAGLPVCEYPVYPVEAAVVDKLCGIVERHDGQPSSRVKDLVDLVVYATHERIDGTELIERLRREKVVRGLGLPGRFDVPGEWRGAYEASYARLVGQTAVDDRFPTMGDAAELAGILLDPALAGACEGKWWDPRHVTWRREAPYDALRVVPYAPEHAEELRAVCLSQASERARTDEAHGRFTLLMYCDAYLEHGVAYMLVDEGDVARGYVLAAEDAHVWRRDFEPYRARIAELGPDYERRVAEELDFYESVAGEYPAHLHIDIDEAYTGCGGGRMLMEALLARLRNDGVPGVVFGVSAANERAVGFYRHMGFQKLSEYSDGAGLTFCMRL